MRHLLACLFLPVLISLHGCSSSSSSTNDGDLCEVATLISDTWPGAGYGDPDAITAVNGKLYYQVNDGVHGEELWVYNPVTGPSLLADIVPGSGGGDPSQLVELDGKLYFAANHEELGRELWSYDLADTIAEASLIADMNSGSPNSDPRGLTVLDGRLYFVANDVLHGSELWVYDPASGAVLLADIRPGEDGSFISDFITLDGKLYFSAHNGEGVRLWQYDPRASELSVIDVGTAIMSFGGGPSHLTVLDERLYFAANDGVHGSELWVYDPATGASLAADINVGSDGSEPSRFQTLDTKLYFAANDGFTGSELWVYDPAAGAMLLADIYLGSQSGIVNTSMVALGGRLYFVGRDDIYGQELREYEPEIGVTLIADIVPGVGGGYDDDPEPPDDLQVFDGILYFSAYDGELGPSRTLWSYTPTTGPMMIDEAWPGTGITRMPRTSTELNGLLYFNANDGVHGDELWAYDSSCEND